MLAIQWLIAPPAYMNGMLDSTLLACVWISGWIWQHKHSVSQIICSKRQIEICKQAQNQNRQVKLTNFLSAVQSYEWQCCLFLLLLLLLVVLLLNKTWKLHQIMKSYSPFNSMKNPRVFVPQSIWRRVVVLADVRSKMLGPRILRLAIDLSIYLARILDVITWGTIATL